MVSRESQITDIAKLIELCLLNDRKAQLKLYELYAKSMYNTSLRIVKDIMMAEDVVQEAFISAFRSLNKFSNEVPFSAWLRKIVINRSLDYLRNSKNFSQEIKDETETDNSYTDQLEIAEDTAQKKRQLQQIREAMMLLPEGYRIIFSLYYYEGYDHEEIAEIMEISASTSRSQLTRAKKKVIHQLSEKNKS